MNIIYYRHNKNSTAMSMPLQKISFFELTIVLKGSLTYKVNGETILLRDGQGIFIDKFSLRQRDQSTEKTDYVSFNFMETDVILPIKTDNAANSDIALLLAYCDSRNNAFGSQCYNELELILKCILTRLKTSHGQNTHPISDSVKKYISENLSDRLLLTDIAEYCHYSVSRLSAIFKKETETSIVNYIIDSRIAKAKGLLAAGFSTLEKITSDVGFSDVNYFIRTFKKRTGMTPSQYRKLFIHKAKR